MGLVDRIKKLFSKGSDGQSDGQELDSFELGSFAGESDDDEKESDAMDLLSKVGNSGASDLLSGDEDGKDDWDDDEILAELDGKKEEEIDIPPELQADWDELIAEVDKEKKAEAGKEAEGEGKAEEKAEEEGKAEETEGEGKAEGEEGEDEKISFLTFEQYEEQAQKILDKHGEDSEYSRQQSERIDAEKAEILADLGLDKKDEGEEEKPEEEGKAEGKTEEEEEAEEKEKAEGETEEEEEAEEGNADEKKDDKAPKAENRVLTPEEIATYKKSRESLISNIGELKQAIDRNEEATENLRLRCKDALKKKKDEEGKSKPSQSLIDRYNSNLAIMKKQYALLRTQTMKLQSELLKKETFVKRMDAGVLVAQRDELSRKKAAKEAEIAELDKEIASLEGKKGKGIFGGFKLKSYKRKKTKLEADIQKIETDIDDVIRQYEQLTGKKVIREKASTAQKTEEEKPAEGETAEATEEEKPAEGETAEATEEEKPAEGETAEATEDEKPAEGKTAEEEEEKPEEGEKAEEGENSAEKERKELIARLVVLRNELTVIEREIASIEGKKKRNLIDSAKLKLTSRKKAKKEEEIQKLVSRITSIDKQLNPDAEKEDIPDPGFAKDEKPDEAGKKADEEPDEPAPDYSKKQIDSPDLKKQAAKNIESYADEIKEKLLTGKASPQEIFEELGLGEINEDTPLALMTDPYIRGAFSLLALDGFLSRDEKTAEEYRRAFADISDRMDQQMMINTMLMPGAEQKERLEEHYTSGDEHARLMSEYKAHPIGKVLFGKDEGSSLADRVKARREAEKPFVPNPYRDKKKVDQQVEKQRESAKALFKMFFMMQMGDLQMNEGGRESEWDHTMADVFAHGGRMMVGLGKQQSSGAKDKEHHDSVGDVLRSIYGEGSGIEERSAATHYVRKGADGRPEELRGKGAAIRGALDGGWKNYGASMAIGGLGREGIDVTESDGTTRKSVVDIDDRNGHMYMGAREGSAGENGALLFGLESDGPYRMNQYGHTHTAAAKAETVKSTGGMGADLHGDKAGGRVLDMSRFDNESLIRIMGKLDEYFDMVYSDKDSAAYTDLLKKLTGKHMDRKDMAALLHEVMGDEADAYDAKVKGSRARESEKSRFKLYLMMQLGELTDTGDKSGKQTTRTMSDIFKKSGGMVVDLGDQEDVTSKPTDRIRYMLQGKFTGLSKVKQNGAADIVASIFGAGSGLKRSSSTGRRIGRGKSGELIEKKERKGLLGVVTSDTDYQNFEVDDVSESGKKTMTVGSLEGDEHWGGGLLMGFGNGTDSDKPADQHLNLGKIDARMLKSILAKADEYFDSIYDADDDRYGKVLKKLAGAHLDRAELGELMKDIVGSHENPEDTLESFTRPDAYWLYDQDEMGRTTSAQTKYEPDYFGGKNRISDSAMIILSDHVIYLDKQEIGTGGDEESGKETDSDDKKEDKGIKLKYKHGKPDGFSLEVEKEKAKYALAALVRWKSLIGDLDESVTGYINETLGSSNLGQSVSDAGDIDFSNEEGIERLEKSLEYVRTAYLDQNEGNEESPLCVALDMLKGVIERGKAKEAKKKEAARRKEAEDAGFVIVDRDSEGEETTYRPKKKPSFGDKLKGFFGSLFDKGKKKEKPVEIEMSDLSSKQDAGEGKPKVSKLPAAGIPASKTTTSKTTTSKTSGSTDEGTPAKKTSLQPSKDGDDDDDAGSKMDSTASQPTDEVAPEQPKVPTAVPKPVPQPTVPQPVPQPVPKPATQPATTAQKAEASPKKGTRQQIPANVPVDMRQQTGGATCYAAAAAALIRQFTGRSDIDEWSISEQYGVDKNVRKAVNRLSGKKTNQGIVDDLVASGTLDVGKKADGMDEGLGAAFRWTQRRSATARTLNMDEIFEAIDQLTGGRASLISRTWSYNEGLASTRSKPKPTPDEVKRNLVPMIEDGLRRNRPVALHKANGDSGHYIVVTGLAKDGSGIYYKDSLSGRHKEKAGEEDFNEELFMKWDRLTNCDSISLSYLEDTDYLEREGYFAHGPIARADYATNVLYGAEEDAHARYTDAYSLNPGIDPTSGRKGSQGETYGHILTRKKSRRKKK